MSGDCFVYPLQSPPDHLSILSTTYNENLRDFIVKGHLQALIADDQHLENIFNEYQTFPEILTALHTNFGIGTLPHGMRRNIARTSQLKYLNVFRYVYNLATLDFKPNPIKPKLYSKDDWQWSQPPRRDTSTEAGYFQYQHPNSVYYLDAIPAVFYPKFPWRWNCHT